MQATFRGTTRSRGSASCGSSSWARRSAVRRAPALPPAPAGRPPRPAARAARRRLRRARSSPSAPCWSSRAASAWRRSRSRQATTPLEALPALVLSARCPSGGALMILFAAAPLQLRAGPVAAMIARQRCSSSVLLVVGVPVAVAVGAGGLRRAILVVAPPRSPSPCSRSSTRWTRSCCSPFPLFVLAGALMETGGIARRLVRPRGGAGGLGPRRPRHGGGGRRVHLLRHLGLDGGRRVGGRPRPRSRPWCARATAGSWRWRSCRRPPPWASWCRPAS